MSTSVDNFDPDVDWPPAKMLESLMSLQSTPDIEQLIRADVALLADAIDTAAINGGGGSNQPAGILNTTGIGSVAGGTNGLAPPLIT